MKTYDFDIAIIGAGPTGLTLANLLGQQGVRGALIERNTGTVAEPRAVSIDDESLRTMQAAGLIEDVLKNVSLDYGSYYLTPQGRCFAKVEPKTREYGFPRRNAFSQPALEATLRSGLARFASVTTYFGVTCETVAEESDGVVLTLTRADGAVSAMRARYAVGCDGARSAIRKTIGATLQGSTYRQRWLIIDLAATAERARFTRVICDPRRPGLTLPGPQGIRRYEFMLHDGESDEEAVSDAFIARLLAASGPDVQAPIARRRVYSFHARIADRWHTDRIFLAGDAAHLSPPFAGQGMNSGLRDAHNLAWKLAAVARNVLGPDVLRSYQDERAPHARALIALAITMGRLMMPTSRIQAFAVQSMFRLARLVPAVHAYLSEMKYKPKPFYKRGFLLPGGAHGVGRMLAQPTLERLDGSRVKLDDVLGAGFALVAYGAGAQEIAARALRHHWGLADVKAVAVVPFTYNMERAPDGIETGRDVHGLFGAIGPSESNHLLVVRPDRYVMAARVIGAPGDLGPFADDIAQLAAQTWPVAATGMRGPAVAAPPRVREEVRPAS